MKSDQDIPNELEKKEKTNIELDENHKDPTFNCHTHIFNFDHVHNKFIKGMFSLKFVFLALAVILALLVLLLLFVQLVSRFCPFNFLAVPPLVYCYSLVAIVVLMVLFVICRRIFVTLRIKKLIKRRFFRFLTKFLSKRLPGKYDILDRMANFIKHAFDTKENKVKKQEQIFRELQSYYSPRTKFIVLTMDLDYMIDCHAKGQNEFQKQLIEIEELRNRIDNNGKYVYKHKLYPFIHADPRRLEDDPGYFDLLKEYIENGTFKGIKIYPALGYFPFDKRLKPVYDLAIEHELPITSHCSVGPVYYRGKLKTLRKEPYYDNNKREFIHPFTGEEMKGKTPKELSAHFTHPLNYYCMMAMPDKLAAYWNRGSTGEKEYNVRDLEKYRNLRFCLGHFGGSSEWEKYLKDAWLSSDRASIEKIYEGWKHSVYGKEPVGEQTYSWHTIIYDMLTEEEEKTKELLFPNLYSDISYNLSNEQMLPLLKIRLETNETFSKKVLFGTDFYMVSMEGSEREITMKLRSFIGEDNFRQIAKINPLEFLTTQLTDRKELLI